MTRLSVNINKIATLRNSRGGNIPNVKLAAIRCQRFGAEGITVHPRPDERHIRYSDVYEIKPIITTEFNIEGYPSPKFINLIKEIRPDQVTLVPDAPDALTSNAGWDTKKHYEFLKELISEFQSWGVRTSIFVDTNPQNIEWAAKTGTNRIELYTEPYASMFTKDSEHAVKPFVEAAQVAISLGLDINAGHDLNLENLKYFIKNVPQVKEVSIGHALISDALYFGLENTIQLYLRELK
ncbi:MAG: pyridoxine 5'-phosphate synthase [Bacteroidales bacterium]|jgi:pyridoxine 5-phosphate synthase|nr:pyridoxine 5'-phosphate synthase [Bacteroidales bacterium]HOL98874.1 pyridoxine 5'-phosphate synthase [Bacteroidales bacterium]HPD24715.1 pyridoxine 5'-phosphate synthase [Bacteroidales bacterium]HRT00460.1 pyridoxine 5'-phosphate synthase [Bacteroidales bacterium]HRT80934.1 pyridoxine 5'-phosphate synthase [Bacteroidales bacterium]